MSYKIVVKEKDKLKTVFKEILNLGGGAEIDDNVVATDKTWSSQKISNELNTNHTHKLLIADVILQSNDITQVDLTSLTLSEGEEYLLEASFVKNSNNASDWLKLFVNNDFDEANYLTFIQKNQGNLGLGRLDGFASILYSQLFLRQLLFLHLKIIDSRLIICGFGHKAHGSVYDELHIAINLVYKPSITSLSSLSFIFSDNSKFKAGSKFRLYKLEV